MIDFNSSAVSFPVLVYGGVEPYPLPGAEGLQGVAVRRVTHNGPKSDIAPCPKVAIDALDAVKAQPGRVCPLICKHGFKVDGDDCVKIVCDSGMEIGDDNTCERVCVCKCLELANRFEREALVVLIKLDSWIEIAGKRGERASTVFSEKGLSHTGDGNTKDSAICFSCSASPTSLLVST
jgi:hypothetical protein